jgi:dihydroorotase-like cyclic amidohydrolase
LTWELVRRGLLEPEVALASVTERAADTLHLPGKGRLAPGFDGDLVLFDPEELFVVRGAELPSRSRWSAYEGWELAGPPRIVVRRGEVCLRDGQLTVTAGGRPLDLQPL